MANVIYPKFKEALLSGTANLTNSTVKIALIDTSIYTYSDTHEFFDDGSANTAVIGTAQTLTSKTVTNGVFDADDPEFSAVLGNSVEALLILIDSGNATTSRLVAYIDDVSTGLPVTPNGGDISITFDDGDSKIFAL